MRIRSKNPMFIFYVLGISKAVKYVSRKFEGLSKSEKILATKKINELLTKNVTPSYLSGWYSHEEIQYISDKIDNIKTPQKFIMDGGGDCDDFVEFAYLILTKSGYKCNRLYLKSKNNDNNHVVLVVKNKGGNKYSIMDNHACYPNIRGIDNVCNYFLGDNYTEYILL